MPESKRFTFAELLIAQPAAAKSYMEKFRENFGKVWTEQDFLDELFQDSDGAASFETLEEYVQDSTRFELHEDGLISAGLTADYAPHTCAKDFYSLGRWLIGESDDYKTEEYQVCLKATGQSL